jgi:hypothetical protein
MSLSWSFVECPYIGDDSQHLVLLHATAKERLHRTAGAAIDDGEHARVGQRLRVDDVLADQRRAHLSGAVGAMANNAIAAKSFLPSATASALPRYSLAPVALKFFTADVSTSPVCSGNVMGELSSGLLKSSRSPAVAGDRASVPPTTVNAKSDTWGAEKKVASIGILISKGILNTGPKTAVFLI